MLDVSPMTAEWFLVVFDDPERTRRWLSGLGVRDGERGVRDLRDLARRGGGRVPLAKIAGQLHVLLPRCADPGMALTNLERFVSANDRPEAVLRVLAEHPRTTEVLVQLFSTSQHFSELMIRDPALLGWLQKGAVRRDREALI